MNKRNLVILALCFLIVAPAAFAGGGPDSAALFKGKCAMCHGPDGAGQTPMGKNFKLRDLGSADVQKQTDAALGTIISDGKGKMPPYKAKLSADEIAALVGYIRSIKK